MKVQNPCMALKSPKKEKKPKVQRGLSMTPELRDAIQKEADKYDTLTWNDIAEQALLKAFLPSSDLSKKTEISTSDQGAGLKWGNVDD